MGKVGGSIPLVSTRNTKHYLMDRTGGENRPLSCARYLYVDLTLQASSRFNGQLRDANYN